MSGSVYLSDNLIHIDANEVRIGRQTFRAHQIDSVQVKLQESKRFYLFTSWSNLLTVILISFSALFITLVVLSKTVDIRFLGTEWIALFVVLISIAALVALRLQSLRLRSLTSDSMFVVYILGDFGVQRVFSSKDGKYVQQVVDAIKLAINKSTA